MAASSSGSTPRPARCDFLEVNLQANLWSEKVFGRSAARAGLSQAELIETILYESLRRHGLLDG